LASDGSFGLAYLPNARTVTVDMDRFSGPVRAMWFDPTNGETRWIGRSPFANSGRRSFTPAPTNSGRDSDWVLVLER
jgi:Putative collagen-binding domain of a collagenase